MSGKGLSERNQRRLRLSIVRRLADIQSPGDVYDRDSSDTLEFDSPSVLSQTANSTEYEELVEAGGACISVNQPFEIEMAGFSSSESDTPTSQSNALSQSQSQKTPVSDVLETAGYSSDDESDDAFFGVLETAGYSSGDESGDAFLDMLDAAGSSSERDFDEASSDSGSETHSDVDMSSLDALTTPSSEQSDPLLFAGSSINSRGFDVSFMSLAQRHNLTYACQDDILKLFAYALPHPNYVPSSSYGMRTKFVKFKTETMLLFYCGYCLSPLTEGSPCCSEAVQDRAVFIKLSLAKQLQERFKGKIVSINQLCIPILLSSFYRKLTES